ncbi:hypothetical protein GX48_04567 [Paracoccidioides brasiliensis]|nr:hypothetical protein GX48_04567 [Paracoccidioides brasiliensis]
MLAVSTTPKPAHIQSLPAPDPSSESDDASFPPDSVSSFTPTPPPPPPNASATSIAPLSLPSPGDSQPSPAMFVKPPVPPALPPTARNHEPSNVSKRPKLSLQTSSLPITFGKSTTALSLALSAGCSASPTVWNTFNNAYDGFRRTTSSSSPVSASSPKCASRSAKRGSSYLCNCQTVNEQLPYKLPLGLRSILRNSPHTSSLRRASLAVPSGNGSGNGHCGRKVLFPAKRRVKYRFPLDEEIKNVRYVARHSDLSPLDSPSGPSDVGTSSSSEDEESDSSVSHLSDDDEPSALTETHKGKDQDSPATGANASNDHGDVAAVKNSLPPAAAATPTATTTAAPPQRPRTKRKHSTSKRQICAVALRENLSNATFDSGAGSTCGSRDNTPQTPLLHKRRKCHRKWRWTLGPVEDGQVQLTTTNDNTNDYVETNVSEPTVVELELSSLATAETGTGTGTGTAGKVDVPLLTCPSPKQRRGAPLMSDVLHESPVTPLPESLRSSPGPGPGPHLKAV